MGTPTLRTMIILRVSASRLFPSDGILGRACNHAADSFHLAARIPALATWSALERSPAMIFSAEAESHDLYFPLVFGILPTLDLSFQILTASSGSVDGIIPLGIEDPTGNVNYVQLSSKKSMLVMADTSNLMTSSKFLRLLMVGLFHGM